MPDVLADTITVESDGDQFVFKVPSPMEQLEVGVRAASLRRRFDSTGSGWEEGLDTASFLLARGIAVMQVLLKKSSAEWPYGETKNARGETILSVNPDTFPPEATPQIIEVYQGFTESLATFHRDRARNRKPAGDQAVEGKPDTA